MRTHHINSYRPSQIPFHFGSPEDFKYKNLIEGLKGGKSNELVEFMQNKDYVLKELGIGKIKNIINKLYRMPHEDYDPLRWEGLKTVLEQRRKWPADREILHLGKVIDEAVKNCKSQKTREKIGSVKYDLKYIKHLQTLDEYAMHGYYEGFVDNLKEWLSLDEKTVRYAVACELKFKMGVEIEQFIS